MHLCADALQLLAMNRQPVVASTVATSGRPSKRARNPRNVFRLAGRDFPSLDFAAVRIERVEGDLGAMHVETQENHHERLQLVCRHGN